MFTPSVGMSIAGFLMVLMAWAVYFRTIPKSAVPAWPYSAIVQQALGISLGAYALISDLAGGVGLSLWVALPLAISLGMGLFFAHLLSIRKTPLGNITVKVGDHFEPFEATTFEGKPFRSEDAFAGKRILLKFFRGGW